MATWDEIKRLAADFQRTQASETLQRISDRNCIDIIKKLTELSLIKLIYTCDGKEFVTPECLVKEIQEEIEVNGGRLQLHELASKLNVDYNHVEDKAKELVKLYPNEYHLILGQVIHSSYQATLTKHVKDRLLGTGQLSVAELAKNLDLPSDFLTTMVHTIMRKVCDDYVLGPDNKTFYTSELMDRYKAKIAGTLAAITKPVSIASIIKKLDIPDKIMTSVLDSMIKSGRVDVSIENRQLVPLVYIRKQNEYIDKFYHQNSYVEYEVVSRLDIKQPKSYLKKRFPDCIPLTNLIVNPNLISQIHPMIEEAIVNNSWIDVPSVLPSCFEVVDIDQMIQEITKKDANLGKSCIIIEKVVICSQGFIISCKEYFMDKISNKVQKDLEDGFLMEYFIGSKSKDSNEQGEKVTKNKQESDSCVQDEPGKQNLKDGGVELNEYKSQNIAIKGDLDEVEKNPNEKEASSKKNRRNKKSNQIDADNSGDEQSQQIKSKSKKVTGGNQGREFKQKAVKKKYLPGNKSLQKAIEDSEDEISSKRSAKGRARKRSISPDFRDNKTTNKKSNEKKPPLVFMDNEKLVKELTQTNQGSADCNVDFIQTIVSMIEKDLNSSYAKLARDRFDEYLKQEAEKKDDYSSPGEDIELVE